MEPVLRGTPRWWPPPSGSPPPLLLARRSPEVDAAVCCVTVDLAELIGRKLELVEGTDILFELRHAAGPDERRRHPRVAERPRQRHLRQRLAAPQRHLVQRPHLADCLLG